MALVKKSPRTLSMFLMVAFSGSAFAQAGPFGSTVMGPIQKLPNQGRPDAKVPFPEVRDWSSVKIALSRSICFGTCPSYTVEIDGNGAVSFQGGSDTIIPGTHHDKISPREVRGLVSKFQKAEFFWLFHEYRAPMTDLPTYKVSISFDGGEKTVVDYGGRAVGMPPEARQLEDEIDAAAEVNKWVQGNSSTVGSLQAEGWNLTEDNQGNHDLLVSASIRNPLLVRAFVTAGMPVNGESGCEALRNVLLHRDKVTVLQLMKAGAPPHAPEPGLIKPDPGRDCDALQNAAASGDPELIDLILAMHPDVNWQDDQGRTALFCAVQAAAQVQTDNGRDYVATVKRLLSAGANPGIMNNRNMTPLMYQLLLGNERLLEIAQLLSDADIRRLEH